MAKGSLRRFDIQANYAMLLAIVSVLPLMAAAYLIFKNFKMDFRQIVYNTQSMYRLTLLGSIGAAVLIGGLGCVLGLNSAGQRRNEKPGRSWLGFWVGGFVVAFGVGMLLAFMKLSLAVTPTASGG